MNDYSKGLQDGYEDAYQAIRNTLELPVSDAEKLRLIARQVSEKARGQAHR